jgi:hypothetical protein
MEKERLAPPPRARTWTGVDDYVVALAHRRAVRKAHAPKGRTEPETPRFLLSTLPFLALFAALAVIAAGIMVAAWPGGHPPPNPKPPERQLGTAEKGWFQEAQREFHH